MWSVVKRISDQRNYQTYLHRAMYDDPDNAHDCHEQIISVSSGLPIATWCKSNVFHDYFHEEYQCQNRGDRSQRFRVFFLDSPLETSEIKKKKRREDRRLNTS